MALLLFLFSILCLSTSALSSIHHVIRVTDNPADKLVEIINKNRTDDKLSSLYANPGLGCIALQYIKAYQGDCGAVGGNDGKKPLEGQFASTFAPNCGVTVSTLSKITGRFIACQTDYVSPSKAFSEVLITNNKSLSILHSKNHTEIGAAVTGTDGGAPHFWCVLFSDGSKNGSFVLQNGTPKVSRPGCFSGANDACSGATASLLRTSLWSYASSCLIVLTCVLSF